MPLSIVTRPDRKSAREVSATRGTEADDVEHPVGQHADVAAADLHHDDDVQRRRLGHALAEAAAQVDDRHHDAAQIEHAAHVVGLPRQMGDLRPALDFPHRHDVDAILLVANGKADQLRQIRGGCGRCFLTHVLLPTVPSCRSIANVSYPAAERAGMRGRAPREEASTVARSRRNELTRSCIAFDCCSSVFAAAAFSSTSAEFCCVTSSM
jgi:hypothetical protein